MVSTSASNNVLVVGSMQNVEAYQAKVLEMKSQAAVGLRSEMLDRILDQAAQLESETYDRALVLVTPAELEQHLPALLGLLQPALKSGSALEIVTASSEASSAPSRTALEAAGWQNIIAADQALTATKPAPAPASVPLRLKRPSANGGARKASLWATSPAATAPSTPTIDESSLLTPDDLKRRQTIQKPDCDVKRTRKACKDCSCGLREILLQEDSDLMAIQAARAKSLPIQTNPDGTQVVNTGAMTSSCGSCSLGDAFRCASCPYLGMPAFEPGQKIELGASSFGGDDLP